MKIPSFVLILTILFSSCKKYESDPPLDSGSNNPPVNTGWGTNITTDVSGKVMDENGLPLSGAIVKAGSLSMTTDANGIFILKNVPAKSSLAYIQVEKGGYFTGSRSFLPGQGIANLRIQLLQKQVAGSFSSLSGGTATHFSGAELMLEPGSVSKNGSPFNGEVRVFIHSIDPTSTNFESRMPGNLFAMDGNQTRGLKSFGMLAAELQDNSGELLQIASGKKAHLKFPIPASLLATASDSIDLWYFDEQNGYWKKEGRAGKEGNFYHALVSHFSFWNCDVPYDYIELKGRILSNGQPLAGARISLSSAALGDRSDLTDTEGFFGGLVPKDELLALKIEAACGSIFTQVFSQNIGPFASNTNLSDIRVIVQGATQVSGNISGCNNAIISGAYVLAGGQAYFPDASGNFSLSACGISLTLTAYGSNPFEQGSTQTISLSGGNASVILQVCSGTSNSTLSDIDGNVYGTVTIGNQVWMKENLKVSKYRNGDNIAVVLDSLAWIGTNNGAYALYGNNLSNNTIYGKLYNWYAVADPRGLCPAGWHVPSDLEWSVLENFLGGDSVAGGKMKAIGNLEDGTGLWNSPNTGATDSSGFTALPGGFRSSEGPYSDINGNGLWWTSSEESSPYAWYRILYNGITNSYRSYNFKGSGNSVRCLKD